MYKTPENSTALLHQVEGFTQNPSVLFQAEMEKIKANMRDLPFYRQEVPCFCPKFILFENQWIGTVVTPWMLSLLVLPGPDQVWDWRKLGDKIAVRLPYKTFMFTVSSLANIPQYLSCSLISPLKKQLTETQAVQLAKDCLTMSLSLPVQQTAPDFNRRNIFTAMVK
ncbi:hydrogenase-2 assembly chaperone [Pasteurellaceae bacterium LIM206]|nr:hydrogenase-2 assembly chaperone [Pasteurellaceae bacterium LIM206]